MFHFFEINLYLKVQKNLIEAKKSEAFKTYYRLTNNTKDLLKLHYGEPV